MLLPPSHHHDRLLSALIIGEPFSTTESTPLLPFLPPLVSVDPGPLFFHLSFASPFPCDFGAPRTLTGRRCPPELHRRLESRHRHPNPPPHRCHTASVSLTSPHLARWIGHTTSVLVPPTACCLGCRCADGEHATAPRRTATAPRCWHGPVQPNLPRGRASAWRPHAKWRPITIHPFLIFRKCI
jgi:hypothetical protein